MADVQENATTGQRGTKKRNMRLPDNDYLPALAKAERLADDGYRGEHGPFSAVDVVRAALRQFNTEDDQETVLRLGLASTVAEVQQ